MAAVALIVAGSGDTTDREVFDLLEDAYPETEYDEVGVVVPADKDLFTDAVQHVLGWLDQPDDVYPVQSEGADLSRASAKLGETQKVEKFTDILNAEEFKDWDDVHFLVALPDDEDEAEFDKYVAMIEVAVDNGIKVFNLCRGLDDVTLEDEDPEPVEEKPEEKPERASRSRKKASEPEDTEEAPAEPEEPAQASQDGLQEELAAAAFQAQQENPWSEPNKDEQIFEALGNVIDALVTLREIFLPEEAKQAIAEYENDPEPEPEPEPEPKAEDDKPKRRGRPRTNFEVSQVWDEETEEWIPRPKGRTPKGTKWRKIHAETGETLEEGMA